MAALDGRVKPAHGEGENKKDAGSLRRLFIRADWFYFDLSNAFKIALVMSVVPTLVMPGCMMSPVR